MLEDRQHSTTPLLQRPIRNMNIGMIVYSQTEHSHSVAMKLQEQLIANGHSVKMERLRVLGSFRPGTTDVQLEMLPSVEPYEALVIGSPVHGGTMAPPMTSYLSQTASLQGKKVACFVTEFFPFPWIGGNQAIGQMKKMCESKGATVGATGIVNWLNFRRKHQIHDVIERLSAVFYKH